MTEDTNLDTAEDGTVTTVTDPVPTPVEEIIVTEPVVVDPIPEAAPIPEPAPVEVEMPAVDKTILALNAVEAELVNVENAAVRESVASLSVVAKKLLTCCGGTCI